MLRSRFLATAATITLLLGAALVWGKDLPRSPSPTTTPPVAAPEDSTPALVDPQVLQMRAVENDLIDEATPDMSTTTAPSSTTTTLEVTTTTAPAPATSAAPSASPNSPPTTPATTTTTISTTTTPPAPAGGYNAAAENDFATRINSYRASNGVGQLARSGSLNSYARSWAKKMAESGSLSHSNVGSLLGEWSSVGENVGVGSSVGQIFDQLVASAPHQSNMVGDFTHFGIGVYQDSNGTLWTAHVFAQ